MERCFTARELVIGRSRLQWNASYVCCAGVEAPIVAFRGRENLQIHVQPTAITHTNDIVIHFRTAKDDGVIFTTWNGHNNDYMKAYLESGHVHLETFIARSSGEVRHAFAYLLHC